MKNLIYVLAVAVMGLVACGAPADKQATEEAVETVVETTDTTEAVAEEVEVDSVATEKPAE